MKKIIFATFICVLFLQQQLSAQTLRSEFLFDLELATNPPQAIGPLPKGMRLIFPFKTGTAKGDRINGQLAQGGGDWGLVLDSTTFKIDGRVTIQTDDGALIYMTYSGYDYADAKTFALISTGKAGGLSPADYYFRTSVSFEASAPRYAWLNHTVAIGEGRFTSTGTVVYQVYAIK